MEVMSRFKEISLSNYFFSIGKVRGAWLYACSKTIKTRISTLAFYLIFSKPLDTE